MANESSQHYGLLRRTYGKQLDGPIRGTSSQTLPVVVHSQIVHHILVPRFQGLCPCLRPCCCCRRHLSLSLRTNYPLPFPPNSPPRSLSSLPLFPLSLSRSLPPSRISATLLTHSAPSLLQVEGNLRSDHRTCCAGRRAVCIPRYAGPGTITLSATPSPVWSFIFAREEK